MSHLILFHMLSKQLRCVLMTGAIVVNTSWTLNVCNTDPPKAWKPQNPSTPVLERAWSMLGSTDSVSGVIAGPSKLSLTAASSKGSGSNKPTNTCCGALSLGLCGVSRSKERGHPASGDT